MKALFLIFHGFDPSNGISKKIIAQVKALKQCGVDLSTCYVEDAGDRKKRMVDGDVLCDHGSGIKGKIMKRVALGCIADYIFSNNIQWVYVRSDHNTTPFLINLFRRLKKGGVRLFMEIPTYPYDDEYKGLSGGYRRAWLMDKCLRGLMARYVDKFVTFSDHEFIFGRPTIRISNGIDFDVIPLKTYRHPDARVLHFIGVATIHPWHGFDRLIKGLAEYYRSDFSSTVYFHIVGNGMPSVVDDYRHLVEEANLEEYVLFHGALFGSDLDKVFEESDLGIGSLARHRSHITHIRTLKNREYAARGIPFVYSEIDIDFEGRPYVLKVPADESPVDVERLVCFCQSQTMSPSGIRDSIRSTLSWKQQMQLVIDEV